MKRTHVKRLADGGIASLSNLSVQQGNMSTQAPKLPGAGAQGLNTFHDMGQQNAMPQNNQGSEPHVDGTPQDPHMAMKRGGQVKSKTSKKHPNW